MPHEKKQADSKSATKSSKIDTSGSKDDMPSSKSDYPNVVWRPDLSTDKGRKEMCKPQSLSANSQSRNRSSYKRFFDEMKGNGG